MKPVIKFFVIVLSFTVASQNTLCMEEVENSKALIALSVALAGIVTCAGVSTAYQLINTWVRNRRYENWRKKNLREYGGRTIEEIFRQRDRELKKVDEEFGRGPSSSHWQGEGDRPGDGNVAANSDWVEWLSRKKQKDAGLSYDPIACDHWHRYSEDFALYEQAGANAVRLSFAWEKIMPRPHEINYAALDHYERVCQELQNRNLKLAAVFFHEVRPIWFAQLTRDVRVNNTNFPHLKKLLARGQDTLALSGWEDPENNVHFETFCKIVFERLHKYIGTVYLLNRPEGYAMQSEGRGMCPPGKESLPLAMQVLRNMCFAYTNIYHAFKAISPKTSVGTTVNRYVLKPWAVCNPLDHLACAMARKLQEEVMTKYLLTGEFSIQVPFSWLPVMVNMRELDPRVAMGWKVPLDKLGVNCYGGAYMNWFRVKHDLRNTPLTANRNYTIHPNAFEEGIRRAAHDLAIPAKVPLGITEYGIATKSDEERAFFYNCYNFVIARLIAQGYPINEIFVWAGVNPNEWGDGENKPYGFIHVNPQTQERTFKEGARPLVELFYAIAGKRMPEINFVKSEELLEQEKAKKEREGEKLNENRPDEKGKGKIFPSIVPE
jgi:beta-glucosidase